MAEIIYVNNNDVVDNDNDNDTFFPRPIPHGLTNVTITSVNEFPESGVVFQYYDGDRLVTTSWSRSYYEHGFFNHITGIGGYSIVRPSP